MQQNIIVLTLQAIVALVLIAVILLQQKGTGLGGAFGGEGNVYRTRRGFERSLFILTIVLAFGYVLLASLAVFASQ